VSETRVRVGLSELEKAGLTRRMADADDGAIRVEVLDGAGVAGAISARAADMDRVRAERLRKLQVVEEYGRLTACRRAFIRRYFGEEGVPETCGHCDVCLRPSAPAQPAAGTEQSHAVAETILRCVGHFNGRLGRSTIAGILAGSQSKRIQDAADWYAEWLGRLKDFPQVRLGEAIDELLTRGYLESAVLTRNEAVFPVLRLSVLGGAVIRGDEPVPSVAVAKAPAERVSAPMLEADEDLALFDRLRAWRLRKARELGCAPFMILSDADLREVVVHRPATPRELQALRGFGPTKVERWGADVLGILAEGGNRPERV
jgi:ATP-dependent DNA helicase RecQ